MSELDERGPLDVCGFYVQIMTRLGIAFRIRRLKNGPRSV